MDWTEKQQCVLCNRGGKLLVCNDNGCPISVHKSCMGCEARLDDVCNFHCPYCLYRRLTAETSQLRKKAILAKKALSKFLNEEMRDGNNQEPIAGMGDKKEKISSTDKTCLENENNLVSNDVRSQSPHLERHQNSTTPLPCEEIHESIASEQTDGFPNRHGETPGLNNVNTCRIMVVYELNSNPVDACGLDRILRKENRMKTNQLESDVIRRVGVENPTGNAKCKFDRVVDNQQRATSIEEEAQPNKAVISSSIEKQITRQKRNFSVAFEKNRNRRKEEYMMEHAAHACVSLPSGPQLRSKSKREIDNDESDSCSFSKKRRHLRHGPSHLLDHPNGATKESSETLTGVASRTEIVHVSNPGELKDSSKQLSATDRSVRLPSQNGKRRVRWSDDEEDMLKEGVEKFSQVTRKNLPWKKILEFGRHVFDASRAPSDLKDKWRNMAK